MIQPIDRLVDQCINQLIGQPTNKPTEQPIRTSSVSYIKRFCPPQKCKQTAGRLSRCARRCPANTLPTPRQKPNNTKRREARPHLAADQEAASSPPSDRGSVLVMDSGGEGWDPHDSFEPQRSHSSVPSSSALPPEVSLGEAKLLQRVGLLVSSRATYLYPTDCGRMNNAACDTFFA